MRVPLTSLIPALCVALLLCLSACGGADIGVTGSAPLGKLEQLDAFLTEKKLTKQPSTPDKVDKGFRAPLPHAGDAGVQAFKYLGTKPGYPHWIGVIADANGKVLTVCGKFRSESVIFSEVGGRTEASVAKIWIAATGGPPPLKERFVDDRSDAKCVEALIDRSNLKGYWLKQSASGDLDLRHEIVDEVVLHLP